MPRRYLIILATFALSVLLYVDRACISTAKDPIIASLSQTDARWADKSWADAHWGWVMAAFAFGYALLQAPAGALSDKYGPRAVLASVVAFWSLFTGLTAAAWNLASLLVVRFLFGAGEAGAFPCMARVVYSWIPVQERGLVKGINFSGSRIGAAVTMPILPWMIHTLGWKESFLILTLVGFVWTAGWWYWFRDEPEQKSDLPAAELEYIRRHRQTGQEPTGTSVPVSMTALLSSGDMWVAMGQYFASNFTFFFCLTWLYPYVKSHYSLTAVSAGFYAMAPLLAGACGNIASGALVDRLFRAGLGLRSRQIPAIAGFVLASGGLIMSVHQSSAVGAVAWLAVAMFGADMTLAPSWSFCIDIGRAHAGVVSGTMNMAGNLGSAVVGLIFPYLLHAFGPRGFFYVGAALNIIAAGLWFLARGRRSPVS